MSAKKLIKIDNFYIIVLVSLVFLAVLVIFTANAVLKSFISSREIDEAIIVPRSQLNKTKMDQALEEAYSREIPPLDLDN